MTVALFVCIMLLITAITMMIAGYTHDVDEVGGFGVVILFVTLIFGFGFYCCSDTASSDFRYFSPSSVTKGENHLLVERGDQTITDDSVKFYNTEGTNLVIVKQVDYNHYGWKNRTKHYLALKKDIPSNVKIER